MSYEGRFVTTSTQGTDEITIFDVAAASQSTQPVQSEPQPPEVLPDGRFIIQTRAGENVWITLDGSWARIPIHPDEWLRRACNLAGSALSEVEREAYITRFSLNHSRKSVGPSRPNKLRHFVR